MNSHKMTYREYQKQTHKTAVYPQAIAFLYLITKLAGEIGELLNLLGKTMRGDFEIAAIKDKIAEEAGGVMWYLAELFTLAGVEMPMQVRYDRTDYSFDVIKAAHKAFMNASEILENNHLQGHHTDVALSESKSALWGILWNIEAVCVLADLDPADVMQRNLDLLAARAAKGTIKGHNREDEKQEG